MEKVYILGKTFSSFVRSVMLVCEEKGINYQVGLDVNGRDIEFKSEEHERLHPYRKIPVLIHNDRVLTETAPICRYLNDNFPGRNLTPEDPWLKAKSDEWSQLLSFYIDKAVVRDYLLELAFPKGEDGKPRFDLLAANKTAAVEAIKKIEIQLADKPCLISDNLTIADTIAVPILSYVSHLPDAFSLIEPDSPLQQYVKRIENSVSGKKVLINPNN